MFALSTVSEPPQFISIMNSTNQISALILREVEGRVACVGRPGGRDSSTGRGGSRGPTCLLARPRNAAADAGQRGGREKNTVLTLNQVFLKQCFSVIMVYINEFILVSEKVPKKYTETFRPGFGACD